MSNQSSTQTWLSALSCLFLMATSTHAVVEAPMPVPTIYSASKAVILGTIVRLQPDTGTVDIKATDVLNGDGFTGPYRVMVKLEDVRSSLAEGQPVVLITSTKNARLVTLHMGD